MKRLLSIILVVYIVTNGIVVGQDVVVDSIISLVNSARNQAGLSSLIPSSELMIAAQVHSDDMSKNGVLDHVGSDGSEFWQRMQGAGYALTIGAENILLRNDAEALATYNQWRNSPSHQANMMNGEYVEVGVAYAQAIDGNYYFTMLLGRRLSVEPLPVPFPTQIPATNTQRPPTATSIPSTSTTTPFPTQTHTATPLIPPTRTLSPLITPVQFTAAPRIVTESFTPILTPQLVPDIRLIYDDTSLTLVNIAGKELDLTTLRFQSDAARMNATIWDTEFLTDRLNSFSVGDCLQVWGLGLNDLVNAPDDCDTRHAWMSVNDSQIFWIGTRSFFVSNGNRIIGQCLVLDGRCELSLDADLDIASTIVVPNTFDRDIRLIFGQDSLTILNLRDDPVDLRGLSFRTADNVLDIEQWDTEFLTASLSGFPTNDCLMAWTFATDIQAAPIECKTRHGWIQVGEANAVWINVGRFDVIRNNRILAGCVVSNGYCDVNLDGNLGDSSPTLIPQNLVETLTTASTPSSNSSASNITSNAVTMIYDTQSFSLINTSGRVIDISALAFESDAGVFSASRWDTEFLSRPLNELPPNDCLQIWGVNTELQSKPSACSVRHSWVAVASDSQFWFGVSQFRVRSGSNLVATCTVSLGQCSVNLP